MKPIKFRAWDIKNKKWIKTYYGHVKYIPITNDNTGLIEVSYSSELADACVNEKWEKEEIILVQFTGLLDKNEKEIYEGDIIKGRNLEGFYKIKEVKWDVNQWYPFAGHRGYEDFEIIGDIYENKELIK